ncbi:MAG: Methyltransferase type 11 [Armatimonadetes bacterium]|nr:Methyltransferase type 11 [Armatimonadota bacterium]
MDGVDLDPGLLQDDLHNLETLNRLFGGRSVIRRRIVPLVSSLAPGHPVKVLDLGSGAGDLCRVLVDECRRLHRPIELISLDFHPQIQAVARASAAAYPELRFIRGDARRLPLRDGSVDLVLCTLALHHFQDHEARLVLAEMARVAGRWAVVSDLCRSRMAYGAVWAATRVTPNPMTRYDGPVSVARAFTPPELTSMAAESGWHAARLYREPWFRMSLVYDREQRW